MNVLEAYKQIKALYVPIFRTSDIAIHLGISNKYGYKLLRQLTNADLIIHLRRDLWALKDSIDLLMLPDYLTSPLPSYISLQSALYHHGLISQIPSVTYAVSIARTRIYNTPVGTYSIHHITPSLFCGFDTTGDNQIHMAQPEKDLFDFFYFNAAKSQLFTALPELDTPKNFKVALLMDYLKMVGNKSRQAMILALIKKYFCV